MDKALRMSRIRRIQVGLSAHDHRFRLSAMHHMRREEGDPPVMMFLVVPVDEFGHQRARLFDRGETLWKLGAVLQRFELRLRVGIVVGDVRTAVGFDHAQVREQERHRFARHRSSPVGMHRELTGSDVLLFCGFCDELLRQLLALLVSEHPADDAAAVDIKHDVEVEIGPGRRSFELGDVPTPELVDPRGEQFGLGVIPGSTGTLGVGTIRFEQAIEGAARTQIDAFVQEGRPDLLNGAVDKAVRIEMAQDLGAFLGSEGTPRHPAAARRERIARRQIGLRGDGDGICASRWLLLVGAGKRGRLGHGPDGASAIVGGSVEPQRLQERSGRKGVGL